MPVSAPLRELLPCHWQWGRLTVLRLPPASPFLSCTELPRIQRRATVRRHCPSAHIVEEQVLVSGSGAGVAIARAMLLHMASLVDARELATRAVKPRTRHLIPAAADLLCGAAPPGGSRTSSTFSATASEAAARPAAVRRDRDAHADVSTGAPAPAADGLGGAEVQVQCRAQAPRPLSPRLRLLRLPVRRPSMACSR